MKNHATDRILPITRWVALLVIPFLIAAFAILYLVPEQTEQLFAWKLQPTMSAMMLGAAYAGGIYFFTALLLSKQWHRIKIGILPVISFASLLGIATILHWDRFNHNHISFWAWAGLYFTTPFIILAIWLGNRQQDHGEIHYRDVVIARWIRILIGIVGAVTLLISLLLFIQPAVMIAQWPWQLSPLTARVMGAMFALPGVVGLGIAFDRRWSAARIILQSQSFSILLILIAAVRAYSEFNWAMPASWLFFVGLLVLLIAIIFFMVHMDEKRALETRIVEKADSYAR